MIKYYKHRGAREDALTTVTEHKDEASILQFMRGYFRPALNADSVVRLEKLDYKDEDYTHAVFLNNQIIGFAHVSD